MSPGTHGLEPCCALLRMPFLCLRLAVLQVPPPPSQTYVPKIYGFRINPAAKCIQVRNDLAQQQVCVSHCFEGPFEGPSACDLALLAALTCAAVCPCTLYQSEWAGCFRQ